MQQEKLTSPSSISRSTRWLLEAGYGVGLHWTTQSLPEGGTSPRSYEEAVEYFDVRLLREQLQEAGAGYLLFTISHAQQYFAFPSALMDSLLPGRTCQRDLYAEMYAELNAHGIKLLFYYPSIGTDEDPQWEEVSRFKSDPAYFASLQYELVAEVSQRYGERVSGWWVDNSHDVMHYWTPGTRYDFARYADALRSGNPDALVAFNLGGCEAWISKTGQGIVDYAAGETMFMDRVPYGENSGEGGSLWHTWIPMDDETWVHKVPGVPTPRFTDQHLVDYVCYVMRHGGVFTYNAAPYQDSLIAEPVMAQLRALKHGVRGI